MERKLIHILLSNNSRHHSNSFDDNLYMFFCILAAVNCLMIKMIKQNRNFYLIQGIQIGAATTKWLISSGLKCTINLHFAEDEQCEKPSKIAVHNTRFIEKLVRNFWNTFSSATP